MALVPRRRSIFASPSPLDGLIRFAGEPLRSRPTRRRPSDLEAFDVIDPGAWTGFRLGAAGAGTARRRPSGESQILARSLWLRRRLQPALRRFRVSGPGWRAGHAGGARPWSRVGDRTLWKRLWDAGSIFRLRCGRLPQFWRRWLRQAGRSSWPPKRNGTGPATSRSAFGSSWRRIPTDTLFGFPKRSVGAPSASAPPLFP